jgi:hypothetical protein
MAAAVAKPPSRVTPSAPCEAQPPGTYPLAAQIPLRSFVLPEFPKDQASHLRELTLTADIKLDEYQSLVQTQPDAIVVQPPLDDLPETITQLTFELFGLGFPGTPPFLTRLAKSLPYLRGITFFSCLVDGLDEYSRRDAEKFFELATEVREVHAIDSFARPGFFARIGEILEQRVSEGKKGVKLLDISYTFRGHEDGDFLARVQGEELAKLIVKDVVGASFDFVPEKIDDLAEEEVKDREKPKNGPGKINEGVLPFASDGRAAAAIRERFGKLGKEGGLVDLRILNLGMWTLQAGEVAAIVNACAGGKEGTLVDLTVSVLLEREWVDKLVGCLKRDAVASLEGIEVVGVPDRAQEQDDRWKESGLAVMKVEDVEKIAAACPKLGKVGMSILKVKNAPNVNFGKVDGAWGKL